MLYMNLNKKTRILWKETYRRRIRFITLNGSKTERKNCDVLKNAGRMYVNMVNQEHIKSHAIQPFDFLIKHHKFNCNNNSSDTLMHIHDKCEIYVNIGGDVSVSVENNTYAMSYGYVCITRPGERHKCIYNDRLSPIPHEYYTIHFSAKGNESLLDLFFKRPAGQNNLLILPFEISKELIFLCSSLLNTSENSFKAQLDFCSIVCILTEDSQVVDMPRLNKYPDICVTLDYINMAGSTALRHIHSARPHETIIFFIMWSPVPELWWQTIPQERPLPIR